MKAKLIIVLLIGLLIGTLLGSFLGQINAGGYDEVYYLKKIYSRINSIYYDIGGIAGDVDDIEDWVGSIYYK